MNNHKLTTVIMTLKNWDRVLTTLLAEGCTMNDADDVCTVITPGAGELYMPS